MSQNSNDDIFLEKRKPKGDIKFKLSLNEEQKEAKQIILDNPVVIKDIIRTKSGMRAYRVEPWVKVIEDEMFFINMDKVITMTEVSDIHTLRMYKRYLRENCNQEGTSRISSSKSMGYISSVSEFKNTLENLYKSS